jgi:hypothetical protein
MLDGVRLDEKSSAAVAVTSWHDQLCLAWVGSDMHINVASSPDGRQIIGKQRLAHRSYTQETVSTGQSTTTRDVPLAPSLVVAGEVLYLAWTGRASALSLLAAGRPGPAAPVTLNERSGNGPSLATAEDGSLALAWTGTDRHLNLLPLAADPGGPPVPLAGAKTRLEQARSGSAPALCSHQGSLVLAWTGSDRHINILTGAQSPYGAPVRLEQARSGSAPALCSHQGSLVLAWSGTDHHLNLARLQDLVTDSAVAGRG